ncbi:putative RNA recognition motif domain, nucleotide-binding alpha-beta plait domain superfamily [Helianthus debilis subsp. tardiflorus]
MEKKFRNREWRLRNCTSFFISNLPESCNQDTLWKAFGHLLELEDVYVPAKRGKNGNRFGFVKLFKVTDSEFWFEKLKEVKIDGAILDVCLAKFYRDGSKVVAVNKEERVSVFERLGKGSSVNKVHHTPIIPQVMENSHCGGRTYRDVVSNNNVKASVDRKVIELPPINTELKKRREFRSLVGEAKDIDILNDLNNILHEGLELSYLGGLKVLISFGSVKEADDYLRKEVESWEKWFSRLYVWEGLPHIFDRVAWIKVLGVPASLWDRQIFNKIGERCGCLLVKSEASAEDGNLAEDRMAVLVPDGKRISEEFTLKWKDDNIKIWVEEIAGLWSPDFLKNNPPVSDLEPSESEEEFGENSVDFVVEENSPVRSPEFGIPSGQMNMETKGFVSATPRAWELINPLRFPKFLTTCMRRLALGTTIRRRFYLKREKAVKGWGRLEILMGQVLIQ